MEKLLGIGGFEAVMSVRRAEKTKHPHRALLWLLDSCAHADFEFVEQL